MCDNKFEMTITLNVLNHLGINLYSNVPSVLSEIVANSWDADAQNVHVQLLEDRIVIIDDGIGMSEDDINRKYLSVGHPKRESGNQVSKKHNRPYMGRKGIGKLSMFSIARKIDVITKKDGVINAFRMNVDQIAADIGRESGSYHPEVLNIEEDEDLIESGTKLVLTDLKRNISSATPEFMRKRIARRFSIIGEEHDFHVFVNDKEVSIEDRDYYSKLNYIWYYGDESYSVYAVNAEKRCRRDNRIEVDGREYLVKGWIGTVESSGALKDGSENLNKIVILVRGKLGQENILDEYSEGGLYSKYLIGEIHADFFDEDNTDDMATSSRQEFKRDDPRFIALRNFIYGELKRIQNDWTNYRNETGLKKASSISPVINQWYESLDGDDKAYAIKMLGKVNQIIVDEKKRALVLRYSVLAFEKLRYSNKLSQIDKIDSRNLEALGAVITGFDDIEATLYYQIIKERTEVIKAFQQIVDDESKERVIQEYLFNHLWLLDPSWERVEGTDFMERSILNAVDSQFKGLSAAEKAARLDIGYRKTAGQHVIIELKRADRVIATGELFAQISKYDKAISKVLAEADRRSVYSIIVVLGKPVDNEESVSDRQRIDKALEAMNARIVFYSELIENAYRSYQEYLSATRRAKPLIDILDQLEESADEGD